MFIIGKTMAIKYRYRAQVQNLRKIFMMNKPMTKEESFAQRRKLFKEVWTTAIEAGDKNSNRPKVVKTLILKDIERSTDKRKKQKIQNLRTVCQDLLQYCDRQEANFSSARSPGPKNREESCAEHSRDSKVKPKTKNRSKSRSLKLPKSDA